MHKRIQIVERCNESSAELIQSEHLKIFNGSSLWAGVKIMHDNGKIDELVHESRIWSGYLDEELFGSW